MKCRLLAASIRIPFLQNNFKRDYNSLYDWKDRAVARALIGGTVCIFIYSGSARLVSFVIKLISTEISWGRT